MRLSRSRVRAALDRLVVQRGASPVARAAVLLVRSLVVTRLSPGLRAADEHRTDFYRRLWAAAAAEVGVPARHLPDGRMEITIGDAVVYARGQGCSIERDDARRTAADKARVYRLLTADGLSVPPHREFSLRTLTIAQDFLGASPGECVVKAAYGTAGGVGVTTGVRNGNDLLSAAAAASAAGARAAVGKRRGRGRRLIKMCRAIPDAPLLIEHQMSGHNYRLLYLDGVLVDALRRDPPTVVGDGRSSVLDLLAQLNRDRLRAGGHHGQALVNRDLDLDQTLAGQGLSTASVPPPGTEVRLKTAINENAPQDNRPALEELCGSIVEQGTRAAELVGGRFVGVDVITSDPTVSLADSGGCLLEVNIPPGLAMHHTGRPAAVEPAAVLLRHLHAASEKAPAR